MEDLLQINSKSIEYIRHKLWYLGGSLKGVGALFEQQGKNSYFESDELFGIGQFLKNTSDELSRVEDILQRCDDFFLEYNLTKEKNKDSDDE